MLTAYQLTQFRQGRDYRLYEQLGAHPCASDGKKGVRFVVWAPNANRVSVVGDFNHWDGRRHVMQRYGDSGLWAVFVPDVSAGALYRFELELPDKKLRIKSDPFAFATEMRPSNASVVCDHDAYRWQDTAWLAKRRTTDAVTRPMLIYEVHLGSWMRSPDRNHGWLSYRELAERLVPHCLAHSFSHIELLPIAEHVYDPSWGYQVTNYFAPTRRFGDADDLRYFVDLCHQNNIGVILDWVPGHFPRDDFALRWFDGTALYEYADPRIGEHHEWGTLVFDYSRPEVRAFLISNALYWIDQFHIDGIRVDAVASMLYLDYNREPGQWVCNQFGGRENLDAVQFLQEFNDAVHRRYPGVITIAEESTAWPAVTGAVATGGLGFDFKWNMGWMHDTLSYFEKDPIHRAYHHHQLTFSMLYAYAEKYILPLSHDEVVHLKGSLLAKMPGDAWQQFANLRLLYAYQLFHPGKKLLFMGGEFAQSREWNFDHSLDWHEVDGNLNAAIQKFVRHLGALYFNASALSQRDHDPAGFSWIDCQDAAQSVLVMRRMSNTEELIGVFNFTPVPRDNYRIGVPAAFSYQVVMNSDAIEYGGCGYVKTECFFAEAVDSHGYTQSLRLTLPPLSAVILRATAERTDSE